MVFLFKLVMALLMINFSAETLWAAKLRPLTPREIEQAKARHQPRRIILAMGINQFNDPFWNDLEFAESDASRIFQVFRHELQIPFDEGELLVSKDVSGGSVTRQHILEALERLKKLNITEDDTLVIYLSTHGTIYLRNDKSLSAPSAYVPYFVAADTQHLDIQNTAISRDELISAFQSLKSQRKALIIATCHSGGGKAQITPAIREAMKSLKGEMQDSLTSAGHGYSILAASSWSEPAVEAKDLKQDIYTHFLLEAIQGNRDGAFTLTQAHDIATRRTISYTQNMQHPTIQMDQSGGDPIVLSGDVRSRGMAFLYSYVNSLTRLELRIGGQSKGIIGDGYMTVPEGKQRIELIDPQNQQVVASRVVRLEPGKEYSVANLIQGQKRWHAQVGAGMSQFHGRAFQRSFAPDSSFYTQFILRFEEAFGIWDFLFSAAYDHSQSETIRMDQEEFQQTRDSQRYLFALSSREPLALLNSDSELTHEWGWYFGPSLLAFERHIEGQERNSVQGADAVASLLGLGLGVVLSSQVPRNGLQWGVNAQLEAYINQGRVQNAESVIPLSQISVFLGVGW